MTGAGSTTAAAWSAGFYTLAASLAITFGVFGQVRPIEAGPAAVVLAMAGRGSMRIARLEAANAPRRGAR